MRSKSAKRKPAARRAARPAAERRPLPPEDLREIEFDAEAALFVPAPELLRWTRETFIEGIHTSALQNEEHSHLSMAHIGMLWTNGKSVKQGRMILGTAEIPYPRGDTWQRARQLYQLREWFGVAPDFLITVSAPYASAVDDATFCALVEHELYHCVQKEGDNGPMFSRETGLPLWAIQGHDVEQFTGVVRRYGAAAAGVTAMVEAAKKKPILSASAIAGACGTCLRAAA